MKIFVKAKPGARNAGIEKIDEAHFIIVVREPPKDGQANIAIQEALAEFFKITVSRVRLVSGFSSRNKVFEI
ncbi:hypothetical protein A3I27_00710 [Candidatus Giovannonibacteria bacterium RIFCSPLOWO2_02_FULL_43_11b]|uniref:Uncharacterized protein n=1 Tax=Candidatus Giovannonibacteria bacterium RIFCSPHIGHO2_12_FULL_43_15 TaxID=1798341 RepID=A0A1F5WPI6_9BACT|nr:MAG: hypothetical protein A3B97_01400 [Candidatus Giovannonibacteria bacterium RIFCSPHIGHO2_02_FULL_43_32]OGF77592.1 MAG: hypothetical protein A3F23_00100 [Candidatus Giovannonibacteria bacterium RIFCSPHIGHO2_12_FULL_43_15]OGF90175.1 MAG: hypothetical protein A3I27_00710 [Candidatus Giovannonibacteria bacterium RIFCSPLOWO2_02_FULL_43_11b]OGF92565.1 MAG: hypothetical protein A3H04_01940 [Candidatus Giovannonibacteria bacterium RIFCSPLOWO2_12_FULL_43_11c]